MVYPVVGLLQWLWRCNAAAVNAMQAGHIVSLEHERDALRRENDILRHEVALLAHAHEINDKMLEEMAYTHGLRSGVKAAG